jgi:hypothetical protein
MARIPSTVIIKARLLLEDLLEADVRGGAGG